MKLRRTYPLEDVKRLIGSGRCSLTQTSKQTAHSLGFSETEVKEVVCNLENKDFCKSETDFYNSASWQDYYRKRVSGVDLFIKLKITRVEGESVLILSFKADESAGVPQ